MRNSDSALLERWIAARDPEAFAQIVDRHAGMVLWTCRRVLGNVADAEETTQDCFLQVSQAQRTIKPSLGGWLHRVATNRALDRLRSDNARVAREETYAAERSASEEPVWNDIQPHVDVIIAELPDELQTPLVLHFFEGQTHREVAKALGLSRSAVTGRIQRAIAEIREQLAARKITLGITALAALFAGYEVRAASPSVVASLKKIGLAAGQSGVPSNTPWKARAVATAFGTIIVATTLWATGALNTSQSEVTASASSINGPDASEVAEEEVAPTPTPASNGIVLDAVTSEQSVPAVQEAPEEMLRLHCVDEAGKPVEGAEVYYVRGQRAGRPMVQDNHPEDTRQEPLGPVLTDAEGSIEVPALNESGERYTRFAMAYARVKDKLVGVWNHSPEARKDPGWDTVVMVKSTHIGGVVTVPAGFDPAKVTVKVLSLRIQTGDIGYGVGFEASEKYRPPLWPELFSTSPARDGAFGLADIPGGQSCYLEFTAPGLGEAQYYRFKPGSDDPISVEMFPEATISGTVRYDTGAPAVDVPVFAAPYGGPNSGIGVTSSFRGRTDSLGRYRITGLPEEVYSVKVQHYGAPPEWISPVVTLLETKPGARQDAVDFVLERGALQAGVLLDKETGEPIPDGWLVAMNPGDIDNFSRAESIGESKTDAAGKFSFRLPTGVSYLYFFTVPEAYTYPDKQGRTIITVEPGEARLPTLTFELAKKTEAEAVPAGNATIEGRVVDEEGRPVAGVPISIGHKYKQGDDERQEQSPSRPSDEEGRFSVTVLATGEHQLVVGGKAFSRTESEWFSVETDEKKSFDDTVVERYEHLITVNIIKMNDEPGASPPMVSVRLRDAEEYITGGIVERGRIEVHVPDTPLSLDVWQYGCKTFKADVEPDTEIEVELEPEDEAGAKE